MDEQQLRETLKSLHEELASSEQLDDKTIGSLQQISDDIHRILDADADAEATHIDSVSEQLKNVALSFESAHPQLAAVVHRLVDGLANLGI